MDQGEIKTWYYMEKVAENCGLTPKQDKLHKRDEAHLKLRTVLDYFTDPASLTNDDYSARAESRQNKDAQNRILFTMAHKMKKDMLVYLSLISICYRSIKK